MKVKHIHNSSTLFLSGIVYGWDSLAIQLIHVYEFKCVSENLEVNNLLQCSFQIKNKFV